jgi:hypothetical protein
MSHPDRQFLCFILELIELNNGVMLASVIADMLIALACYLDSANMWRITTWSWPLRVFLQIISHGRHHPVRFEMETQTIADFAPNA